MSSYYSTLFLMKIGLFFALDQVVKLAQADTTAYQRLIDKVIYLDYGIQLDIAFIIGQLSHHNLNT